MIDAAELIVNGRRAKWGGAWKTRLYSIWRHMIERCEQENHPSFQYYGAKGVSVCDEWRCSFFAFKKWAEEHGYNDELTIDRKDNSKGYSPDNCRFATQKEQQRNRSTNRLVNTEYGPITIKEASERFGIHKDTIRRRLETGWSDYDATHVLARAGQRHMLAGRYRNCSTAKRERISDERPIHR